MSRARRSFQRLRGIDGIETDATRPGTAEEGEFQGYVSLRSDGQAAVKRLLARLRRHRRLSGAVFHVGDQKCELGFRVEVTMS